MLLTLHSAAFNDIVYSAPKVPTLYSVLTSGPAASDVVIYGKDTNAFILDAGDVVEIVLNNLDTGKHPFHLHGHNFQTVVRSDENAGLYNTSNHTAFPTVPMRRDTLMVRPQGNFAVRFRADNPGVWLFHCHIQWHMDSGLVATMIEAPLELQKTLTLPTNHLDACKAGNSLMAGNAAGNTKDLYDLNGQNLSPGYLPAGFTARGVVALVFSIISALLGMACIAWYGSMPIGKQETANITEGLAKEQDVSENK